MGSKNKKLMVTTIIGITTLVLLVAGATYAYFSVPIQNNYSKTKITSKIDSIGNVTLMPGSELAMEITGAQMMNLGEDVPYYGSSEGTTDIETSEVIGTASVTGNGVFTCTYDLTMNATGENNMYDAMPKGDGYKDQLVLTVNGVNYDFNTTDLFPKTIKGEMTGLTEGVSQDITAQLRLINATGGEQNWLIGTDIEITFEIDNFNCTVTGIGTSGAYVMATSPDNISEELVEGLYRYQGTEEEVTNNYICFGTSNKDTCLETQAMYMYRLIGITPDGQLKIISNGPMVKTPWHNTDTNSNLISWPYSTIFRSAQSNANYYGTEWGNIILNKVWEYGTIYSEDLEKLGDVLDTAPIKEFYSLESKYNNKVSAKIGLLTLTDVYTHDTCYDTILSASTCASGWLVQTGVDEWTMTKINTDRVAYIGDDGMYSNHDMTFGSSDNVYYRPVAYLNPNLTITGTGTIDDPYMISI